MITWVRENSAALSVAGTVFICVSIIAVNRYQLSGLVAAQPVVHQHINDSTRHLDAQRDAETTRQLLERISQLERKVERCERIQIWMATSIRANNTSSIPLLSERSSK